MQRTNKNSRRSKRKTMRKRRVSGADSEPPMASRQVLFLPELLELIFERTILHECLVDLSNFLAPFEDLWRQNQRQKRHLVSVCQTWRSVANRFLYRDISICNIDNLFLLERTLQENPEQFRQLVKSFAFCCTTFSCDPRDGKLRDYGEETTRQTIEYILSVCPNLADFSVAIPSTFWGTYLRLGAIPNIPPQIKNLHLDQCSIPCRRENIPVLLLSTHRNLLSLSVSLNLVDWGATRARLAARGLYHGAITDKIVFPHLTDLRLFVDVQEGTFHSFTDTFEFPSLKHLTLIFKWWQRSDDPLQQRLDLRDSLVNLLAQHAKGIEYLEISCPITDTRTGSDRYSLLINQCISHTPFLRHLVVHYKTCLLESVVENREFDSIVFHHPNLRWLDICELGYNEKPPAIPDSTMLRASNKVVDKSKLPALQGVRLISTPMESVSARYPLLRMIPPDSTEEMVFRSYPYGCRSQPGEVVFDFGPGPHWTV